MKLLKVIVLMFVLTFSLSNDDIKKSKTIAEADTMFEKISKERVGLKQSELEATESPFISAKDNNKIIIQDINGGVSTIFVLKAVLSNRAKINDKWYKIGDSVDGVIIQSISNTGVVVTNETEKQTLKIVRENKNVEVRK